jgi:hypothetical protein
MADAAEHPAGPQQKPANAAPRISLDEIRNAWKKRQSKVVTAKFTWDQHKRLPLNTLVRFHASGKARVTPPVGKVATIAAKEGPRALVDFPERDTLCLDGERLAFSETSMDPELLMDIAKSGGDYQAPFMKVTMTGNETRRYETCLPGPSRSRAIAYFTTNPKESRGADFPSERPLLVALRPTTRAAIELSSYHVSTRAAAIGDAPCVIIEADDEHHTHSEYWLEPARDFIPLRFITRYSGGAFFRFDVEYQKAAACGWVPSGWRIAVARQDGYLISSWTATVTSFSINPPLAADDFELKMVDGTYLRDLRDGRQKAEWIGIEPPVQGAALPTDRANRWLILLCLNAGLVLVLAAALAARRLRRN